MARDVDSLLGREWDLVIVGGGIHGAWALWDAATRGLSALLLERGDFGGATSANSLKTIHSGFRYLSSGDLLRKRRYVGETRALLRVAPHLVRPLPCILVLGGGLTTTRPVMAAGLLVNDFLGLGRNRGVRGDRRLPGGRLVDANQVAAWCPALGRDNPGGALWYDAQVHDSERLTISLVRSACQAGATAANYVEARGLLGGENLAQGVAAHDLLGGRELEIKAHAVLDAAGPWMGSWRGDELKRPSLAWGINLVLERPEDGCAVGFRSLTPRQGDPVCGGGRYLFLAPWQGRTLLGTAYQVMDGDLDRRAVGQEELRALLEEANQACPGLDVSWEQVSHYHYGVLPLARPGRGPVGKGLATRELAWDAGKWGGPAGLVGLRGVKFTSARWVAERGVDLVCQRLRHASPCFTARRPIWGGAGEPDLAGLAAQVGAEAAEHLVWQYGDQAQAVVESAPELAQPLVPGEPVLACEVAHAVEAEMAQHLEDVALRRTVLGQAQRPSREALSAACQIMAQRLSWDGDRQKEELARVERAYVPLFEPRVWE